MPPTPRQQLADLAFGQSVVDYITSQYAAGRSYRNIAADLRDATNGQIDVSDVTIRAWRLAALKNAA